MKKIKYLFAIVLVLAFTSTVITSCTPLDEDTRLETQASDKDEEPDRD